MTSYEICYYKIPTNFTEDEKSYVKHNLIPKIFPKFKSYMSIMDKYKTTLDNSNTNRVRLGSRRGKDLKKWLNVNEKARYAFYAVKEM